MGIISTDTLLNDSLPAALRFVWSYSALQINHHHHDLKQEKQNKQVVTENQVSHKWYVQDTEEDTNLKHLYMSLAARQQRTHYLLCLH